MGLAADRAPGLHRRTPATSEVRVMDDARFDALARSLGQPGPRRGALKALAALAVGSLTTRLTTRPATAATCTTVGNCLEKQCQRVACQRGTCVYEPIDGCCVEDSACTDEDPCTRDTCNPVNHRCEHAPKPEGAPCATGQS